MYFCGVKDENTLNFITSALIDVTGYPQLNVSVDETPVPGSVSPADPVILQCSVLSEIRSAELRVFWFRSAAGSSFPEIIFTHHNSSQPGTHRCVYNFSPNITNNSHAHYCAMATCWRLLPYRSPADLTKSAQNTVFYLWPALGVCITVIFAQILVICITTKCDHCSESAAELIPNQDLAAAERTYAAKQPRVTSGNSVHCELEYFMVTDMRV
ncbi:uncharacterized protein LOC125804781 isoform X1 [Astyanax mexicanus]|uniref:uncharacterized protein LOC125804781 isoform X1 n=1 Tax=Astyanax mexicanus TaxID=7994 RepID=UPI0020CABC2D|nr:uncharacterized protein LOC125804781 isoform X1 [Astyanax mexicanus]